MINAYKERITPMATTEIPSASSWSHNKRLKQLLIQVDHDIHSAQSQDDLVAIIEQVKAFNGPLAFKHPLIKATTVIVVLLALLFIISSYDLYGKLEQAPLILIIGLGIFQLSLMSFVWQKKSSIRSLARKLYQQDLLFDNHLRPMSAGFSILGKRLLLTFAEFQRGNYSREIMAAYKGVYRGDTHSFDYNFYHFHYVDKHTETYKDSKGNQQTRISYSHYDRYGIYMPFMFASNMVIASDVIAAHRGTPYKPASNRFNRKFKVGADTEMTAARFLKPAIVLACEDIAEHFKKLNLEFNDSSALCMSFENDMVISSDEQKNDFHSPDAFIDEIKGRNELPELTRALTFIHTLMVHSDSNFKKETE